jgi:hypothetical protein
MPFRIFAAFCMMVALLAGCSSKAEKQARDAFLYGYPLVMTEETRQSSSYPANSLQHLRSFPDHTFRNVVRPNVDTLYSIIWLDLKEDAVVLELPDSKGRYVLMPVLDGWSNVVASIGSRTTGTAASTYLIAGPDWADDVPEGMTLYRSPTALGWMIGRIYAEGPDDFEGAHAYQNGMALRTLSDFQNGVAYIPQPDRPIVSVDIKQKIQDMDASDFFEKLERLMVDNPPAKEDEAFLEKTMQPLTASKPSAEALTKGKRKAYKRLGFIKMLIGRTKGWMGMDPSRPIGKYGTDYQMRAFVAHIGFGANEPVDAIYPNTSKDAKGKKLHSSKNYVVHFNKDELPPVNAFWSLTLYDEYGFLTENPIGRYALGTANELPYNTDGSLDIYVQHDAPRDEIVSNWLPAPTDAPFALTLRLYWPDDQVLEGNWNAPDVLRVKEARG